MKDEFEEIDKMTDEELLAEMKSILAEVEEDEKVKDAAVPEESFNVVFSQIREIEERRARENLSKRDKKLLEYGRRYERQLHFRKYWILAAVLVLVLAMGMTSVGGPERFFQRVVGNLSGRNQELIDSTGDNIIPPENWDEEAAYEAIEEKYGFYPVRLDYLPEGVVFDCLVINEEIRGAQLLYAKKEKLVLELYIHTSYNEGSLGVDVEDSLLREFEKQIGNNVFKISEYIVEKSNETRWKVGFENNDVFYWLIAHEINQSQLEEVISNILFV